MIRLTQEREAKGWSKAKLGRLSAEQSTRIVVIENGRAIPYPVELARIAAALGWKGDPTELLDEVTS